MAVTAVQSSTELSIAAARHVLTRMTELPSVAPTYQALLDSAELDWNDVPVLTKDEFRAVFPDVLSRARALSHGALVLGSGGTTAEPKLSLIPSSQLIDDIRTWWSPLDSNDVLVNYDTPGRLCSSHNFFNALAHGTGAVSIPLGAVADDEMDTWLDFAERLGATALNATQSHIAHLLEHCESTGRRPPQFRKLLWTGEAFSDRALALTRRLLPHAALHGVYGSTETWVIGHNGPSCDLSTFHLLPYQHVELLDGLIVVTNLHPQCLNPVVRYRIGDRGEFTTCACGRPGPAMRVLGRDDPQLKFLSILVAPQEIAQVADTDESVSEVQIALFDHGGPDERMELRLRVASGADPAETERRVRESVLSNVYRLGYEVAAAPGAFAVRVVDKLTVNRRSNKTPLLVKDEHID